jgi:phasin family protein
MREVQFKALDAAKANADASFDLVRRLLTVTSVADAVQIQTAFARERFEAFVDYSKDVQTTLSKVSTEATKPAKTLFDKALSTAQAA